MTNLCVVHSRLESRGGSERWVFKMAQHYNAPVYCFSYNPDKTFDEFKNVDIRIISAPLLPLLFFLPKKIRESIAYSVALSLFKADGKTVICCTPPAELAAIRNTLIWYCQSPNRLAFDSFEDKMVKETPLKRLMYSLTVPFFRVLDKFAVSKVKKVFANSENISARLDYYMDVDAEVLYQGVNTDDFYSEEAQTFFFYPSRITRSKRFEMAIEAFGKLDLMYRGKVELVIAGFLDRNNSDDVRYFEEITFASKDGMHILPGITDAQMKKLYATCISAIYTPKNEDFGLVPVEAAASGKPCIGINEGGLKETIIDGGTGFLVNNVEELAEKMELMLKTPKLASELGKRAKLVCKEKFSWEKFFEVFDEAVKG
jgi:glycosyltransferase involved in cell wall biosynthesis